MQRVIVALLLSIAAHSATARDFSFGRPVRLSMVRESAGSVAVGDANGDGRIDLAVTEDNGDAHQLALYLQRPDGTLGNPVRLTLSNSAYWALPVAFADLDGDGRQEILVGAGGYLLGVRYTDGALTAYSSYGARYGCSNIATADIDGDGRTDVVCHSAAGMPSSATIYLGNGSGTYRSVTDMETHVGSWGYLPDFEGVQVADVTGDRRPDLVVTASRNSSFFVYANNGVGAFVTTPVIYPHPPAPKGVYPAALQILDIDDDGANEVITVSPDNRPDAMANIYRRNWAGQLVLSQRYPIHDSPTALLAADVDGQGSKELLVGHYDFHAISVLYFDAFGLARQPRFELPGFGNEVELYRLIGETKSIAAGDLNGDGCADLAAATYAGTKVLYGCRPSANQVPVSDFDGDGVGDLLWRQDATGENYLWQWADVNAWITCALPCPVYMTRDWVQQAVGDFDGDGSSDVFWRHQSNGANQIVLKAFYKRSIVSVTDNDWQVVGAGDFDGDDRSDLFWRNLSTGANTVWLAGNYHDQLLVRGVADLAWKVVGIGDFDGDGRSDVLWRHGSSGRNAVWLAADADHQQTIFAVTNPRWKVAGVGDFDGDGRDDVFWRDGSKGVNAIWRSANYATQQAVTGVIDMNWQVVAVADYNGDGFSDLMWRNGKTWANVIWLAADSRQLQPVASAPSIRRVLR